MITQYKKIKIYLSARISKDAHARNENVCNSLHSPISIFMPQKHNPWNMNHEKFSLDVYSMDLKAMEESHMCLVLPPYGRDCAWEIGWYSNSSKPVIVFIDKEIEWLRDWMVKGGISYVVTTNQEIFFTLKKDPILKSKEIFLIKNLKQLNCLLTEIFRRHYE